MTAEAAGLGLAGVLGDHVMSGEPECLSPSMVWVWRCVCNPGYAHAASARSVALSNHRAHVAEEVRTWLRAALTSPEVVEAAALALRLRFDPNTPMRGLRDDATAALAAAAETLGAK